MTIPIVRSLFSKPQHGAALCSHSQLDLKAHYGIQEDINADPFSPRQVLVVRQEELAPFQIPPGALRENILISGLPPDKFLPGSGLKWNNGVTIRLTFYCEPCKLVKPFVSSIKMLEHKRGILGVVQAGGRITVGDRITVQPHAFPPLSDIPYERFLYFVRRIPEGKVVTYRQILTGIGVSRSYFRVLPLYIRNALKTDGPVHRVLDSHGCLVSALPNQHALLAAEGVRIEARSDRPSVPLDEYAWDGLIF